MVSIGELKYATNVPNVRNKFENVKKRFYENWINEPNASRINAIFLEYKRVQGSITPQAKKLLNTIYLVRSDDGAVYLMAKDALVCDLYITEPRGIRLNFNNILLNCHSQIELSNVFNIYGSEGFTLCISTAETSIVIEPTCTSGMKGSGSVALYVLLENNTYVIADASEYLNVNPILMDYRG